MASILWDFSRRRLFVKQNNNRSERSQEAIRGEIWGTHLLSLDSNKRLSMRFATVCTGETMTRGHELQKDKSEGGRLMEEAVVPCSSSEAASLLWGVDYKCINKRYETVQSRESSGFPE